MIRHSLLAFLLLLALSAIACGGGSKEAAQPTAPSIPTSATTPVPMNTPVITGNLFDFKDKGYSVRFPEGWTPMPNFVPAADFSVDAFFAPPEQEVQNVRPNVAVSCAVPAGMNLKDYFDREVQIVKGVTKVDPDTSSRQVSGQDALQLTFSRENVQAPLEKTEIIFVGGKCIWTVSLTVPFSSRDNYHEPFQQFVDSFHLEP